MHKSEFREFLKNNSDKYKVEHLQIPITELHVNTKKVTWLHDNKEIKLGSETYDVIEVKKSGKQYVLSIVLDKEEKALFKKYQQQANSIYNNQSDKNGNQNLVKDFFGLKYMTGKPVSVYAFSSSSKLLFFMPFYKIALGFSIVQTPPPIA